MTTLRKLTTVMELDIKQMVDGVETIKNVTKQATVSTRESTEAIEKAFSKVGRVVKVTENKTLTATAAITANKRAVDKAQRVYDGYASTVDHASKMIGKSALEQAILNKQFQLGAGATEKQKKAIADLVRQEFALSKSSKQASSSFRLQKNSAQQLGFQMQDIAVQAQMGTSAFVILGQQGSQLAGTLGPGGALIGAAIAVGAAVGGVLFTAMKTAKEETKEIDEAIKSLKGSLDGISGSGFEGSIEFQSKTLEQVNIEINKLEKNNKDVTKSMSVAAVEYSRFNEFNRAGFSDTSKFNKAMKSGQFTIAKNSAEITKLNELKRLQSIANGRSISEVIEAEAKTASLIKALKEQSSIAGLSAKVTDLQTAATNGANSAQILAIATYHDTIDAAKNKKKSDDELARSQENLEKSSAKYLASLSDQVALIGIDKDEKFKLVAANKASNDEEEKAILIQLRLKDAKLANIKSDKDRVKLIGRLTESGKLAVLDKQYKLERDLLAGHQDELIQLEKNYSNDRTKISGTAWEKWSVSAQENLGSFDDNVAMSLDRLSSGFGDAFAGVVLDSDNVGDAIKGIFVGGLRSMIAFFGEWAIQRTVMWALDQTLDSSANVAKATTMTSDAAALSTQAGLAAYASTAAIPIVGPGLAPKAALEAIAATAPMAATVSGLAFAGAFDKGGLIPSGSSGIVSEIGDELVGGTMVYNGSPNSLKVTGREESAQRSGRGGDTFNVNSHGNASADSIVRAMIRQMKKGSKAFDNAVYDSMNRGRKNGGKRFTK